MVVLSKQKLKTLTDKGFLVNGISDFEKQIQPNGIDLTVRSIEKIAYDTIPVIGIDFNVKPEYLELEKEKNQWFLMPSRSYIVSINETINLPKNTVGLVFPRSSLIRTGNFIHTAVWDSGYVGSGKLLLVINSNPIYIEQNARIAQMVFFECEENKEGYQGQYQGEK